MGVVSHREVRGCRSRQKGHTYIMRVKSEGDEELLEPRCQPVGCRSHLLAPLDFRSAGSIENKNGCDWEPQQTCEPKVEHAELWVLPSLRMKPCVVENGLGLIEPDAGSRD